MNYIIVASNSIKDLVEQVNYKINNGWKLLGNPFFGATWYHQALITSSTLFEKKEEE